MKETTTPDDQVRAELKEGLNVEDLFARFTVRWIEMQYCRYTTDVVPRMLNKAEWQPLDFSQVRVYR
jgi:hypothetical protein